MLLAGRGPDNNLLLAGRGPDNNLLLAGFLVTLGSCAKITVSGGMSIAKKGYRVEVDEEHKKDTKELQTIKELSLNTYISDQEEICTGIIHCYESVLPARKNTKFCDKDKVCCKTKGKY